MSEEIQRVAECVDGNLIVHDTDAFNAALADAHAMLGAKDAPHGQPPPAAAVAPAPEQAPLEEAFYRYLTACARLAAGQVEGLPWDELEDIVCAAATPRVAFNVWLQRKGLTPDATPARSNPG